MTFEEALRAELSTITGLNKKVLPLHAKEGMKAPYIVYVSSEGLQDKTLNGYRQSKEIDCEINILHNTYSDMKALTKLVLEKVLSFQNRYINNYGELVKDVHYEKPIEIYENEVKL